VDVGGTGDFTEIQEALNVATSGDTVRVAPGRYFGPLDFHGKDVTLESASGPGVTILDGQRTKAVSIGPRGALIGFTITNAFSFFGAAMEVKGSRTLVQGNIFQGNEQSAGGFGAAIGGNTASPQIERNLFRNNSCDDQFLSGVVTFVNFSSPRIVNNVFEDNPCRAINMTLPDDSAPDIINNTLVRNTVGIKVSRGVSAASQIYRNNIIQGNGIGLEVETGTEANNPRWENNLVFGNGTNYVVISDLTGIAGNISVDALFVDAVAGDYRLRPESPAIDAGAPTTAPAEDFDGRPRPQDGDGDGAPEVDMGAFEAVAALPKFIRGDANADGKLDITDAIGVLNWLFTGSDPPPCVDAADADDDGQVAITDPIKVLGHLFSGTEAPPPPFPGMGPDPTPDALDCLLF
jgi:hypothetical protein